MILSKLDELAKDIRDIKSSNLELKDNFRAIQEEWKKEREELKNEIELLHKKVFVLEEAEESRKRSEKRLRFIITGKDFKESSGKELNDSIKSFLEKNLKIKADINDSYKIQVKNNR